VGTLRGTVKQKLDGRSAVAAVRPDEIAIGPPGAANAIIGEVEGVEYYGRDCLVEIVAAGGLRLYVRSHGRVERGTTVSRRDAARARARLSGEQAGERAGERGRRTGLRTGLRTAHDTCGAHPPIARRSWSHPRRRSWCSCSSTRSSTASCCRSARARRTAQQLRHVLHQPQPVADDLHHATPRAAGDHHQMSRSRSPIAYQMRRRSRYQKIVTTILVIPMTLGTVLIAEGMLTYLGPRVGCHRRFSSCIWPAVRSD